MGWLIAWLIDSLIWLYRDYRTSNWPTSKGEVQSSQGCGLDVVVTYTYPVTDYRLGGFHGRSFQSQVSAGDYARLFTRTWPVIVRYSGADPVKSIIIGSDQTPLPTWATRYADD